MSFVKGLLGIDNSPAITPTTPVNPQAAGDTSNGGKDTGAYTSLVSTSAGGLTKKASGQKRSLLGGA